MRRELIQVAIVLVTALPATAQIQPLQAPKALSAGTVAFQAEPRMPTAMHQTAAPVKFAELRLKTERPSQLARMAAVAPVATMNTPFVAQVDVRLASIWGGRVQLGGYQSVHPMENLLHGLPGSGVRPSSGVGSQTTPGRLAAGDSESFGLSLTVALSSSPSGSGRTDAWRCLARMIGMRGCRLR